MYDINVIANAVKEAIDRKIAPETLTLEEVKKMEIHSISSEITLFIHVANCKFIIVAWNNDKQAVTSIIRCK